MPSVHSVTVRCVFMSYLRALGSVDRVFRSTIYPDYGPWYLKIASIVIGALTVHAHFNQLTTGIFIIRPLD